MLAPPLCEGCFYPITTTSTINPDYAERHRHLMFAWQNTVAVKMPNGRYYHTVCFMGGGPPTSSGDLLPA